MKTDNEIFNSHKTMVDGKEVLTYGNAIKALNEYAEQFKPNEQQGGVVRPEVEGAKEGEPLPASDGEANTCADFWCYAEMHSNPRCKEVCTWCVRKSG